ncbi:GxxExxY protein [Halocola ammonii]
MLAKKLLRKQTYDILNVAIEVHKQLGPGLLESVYHTCMFRELQLRGFPFRSQLETPINYKGLELEARLRCDFLIFENIVVELKAVEQIAPVYQAQILSYMQLLEVPKGILINFHVTNIMKEGQQTFVNEIFRKLPD